MRASLETDLQAARGAGFDYLEIWKAKLRDRSIPELKDLFAESGVPPLSTSGVCATCASAGGVDKGAGGKAAVRRWSGRRVAPTALRCSVLWPVAKLAAFTSFTALRQLRRVRWTKRAARAATSPGLAGRAGPWGPAVRKAQAVHWTACVRAHLLGAPEAHRSLPARAFAVAVVLRFCRFYGAGQALPMSSGLKGC